MPLDSTSTKIRSNTILSSLSEKAAKSINSKLVPFELKYGEKIYEAGDVVEHVYFPDRGMISLLATLGGESLLEVGIVGFDGVLGLSTFLGSPESPNRTVVQGQGVAQKMKAADFLNACSKFPELTKQLHHYTQVLMTQISQSAVCYRFHKVEQRLARWLLISADYMLSDEFRVTQDFLSHMLGVRREGV
ncbi:MAG: Crp/Fnr family transcriptional regulator, partial [Acidobacteriota bacterium]